MKRTAMETMRMPRMSMRQSRVSTGSSCDESGEQ